MEIIQDFFTSQIWLLNIIFLLLAIASIVATIITSNFGKNITSLAYLIESINLIDEKMISIKSLNLSINNAKIDNLNLTIISLWNFGNKEINNSDITSKSPLIINFPKNTQIYSYEYETINSKFNQIEVIQISNGLNINFDFLSPNDGIKIKFFHNRMEKDDEFVVSGNFKDGSTPKEWILETNLYSNRFLNFIYFPRNNKNIFFLSIYFIVTIPIVLPILIITGLFDAFRSIYYKKPKKALERL